MTEPNEQSLQSQPVDQRHGLSTKQKAATALGAIATAAGLAGGGYHVGYEKGNTAGVFEVATERHNWWQEFIARDTLEQLEALRQYDKVLDFDISFYNPDAPLFDATTKDGGKFEAIPVHTESQAPPGKERKSSSALFVIKDNQGKVIRQALMRGLGLFDSEIYHEADNYEKYNDHVYVTKEDHRYRVFDYTSADTLMPLDANGMPQLKYQSVENLEGVTDSNYRVRIGKDNKRFVDITFFFSDHGPQVKTISLDGE